jgi:hypothetical protein
MGIKSQRIIFIFLVIVVVAFSLLKNLSAIQMKGSFPASYEVSHFHLINREGDIGVGINCQDYFSAAKNIF